MKTKLLLLLLLANFSIYSQYTVIPDANFENKLIASSIDDIADGRVLTSSISNIIDLDVRSASIVDLTGIEDFTALKILVCSDNALTNLNVTKNKALKTLFCEKNQLSSLNVSQNINLDYLICHTNQLVSLKTNDNLLLTYLSCGLNKLTDLDVSKNTKLTNLYCSDNKLVKLNIKNGNNINITALIATKNPNLSCIQVDDADYADSFDAPFYIDPAATYSTNCGYLGIEESVFDKVVLSPNPTIGEVNIDNVSLEKATVYNTLGQLVKSFSLNSGSTNNTISLAGLPKGVYYVYLINQETASVKKVIVK